MWKKVFAEKCNISAALKEFAPEDSPDNFLSDAKVLKSWI